MNEYRPALVTILKKLMPNNYILKTSKVHNNVFRAQPTNSIISYFKYLKGLIHNYDVNNINSLTASSCINNGLSKLNNSIKKTLTQSSSLSPTSFL